MATPGIYPTGNICEGHQAEIKGTVQKAKVIDSNVSLDNFLTTQMPNLLAHECDRMSHLIAGRKEFPKEPSVTSIALRRFYRKGIDILHCTDDSCNEYYLANTSGSIGVPVSHRVPAYNAALEGRTGLFLERNNHSKYKAAYDMIRTTRSLCKITISYNDKMEPIVIGDCENCIKKLGYDCPGVIAVRDIVEDFAEVSLGTLASTQPDPVIKNGSLSKMGLSSMYLPPRNRSKQRRMPGLYVEDTDRFMKGLRDKKVKNICMDLRLFERETDSDKVFTVLQMKDCLCKFDECPTCFRGAVHNDELCSKVIRRALETKKGVLEAEKKKKEAERKQQDDVYVWISKSSQVLRN